MIELSIPFPPSLNGFQRNISVNRRVDSPAYKKWKAEATQVVGGQYPLVNPYKPVFLTPVTVNYVLCPPDKRVRDLDNYAKVLGDFLVDYGFLRDDSLIHRLTLEWGSENRVTIREKI